MAELLVAGVVAAVLVGVNVGGSSTGVAFGPAVGANAISQVGAGVLMSLSALIGGWTVGRNVISTVGHDIIAGPAFSLSAESVCMGRRVHTCDYWERKLRYAGVGMEAYRGGTLALIPERL